MPYYTFFSPFSFSKRTKKCKFRESKVMLIFLTLPANKELQNTTTTVLPSASILPFYRNNNAASSVPPVQKLYSVALVKPQISCLSLGWTNRCCHFQHWLHYRSASSKEWLASPPKKKKLGNSKTRSARKEKNVSDIFWTTPERGESGIIRAKVCTWQTDPMVCWSTNTTQTIAISLYRVRVLL